jgi:hypothetical protein
MRGETGEDVNARVDAMVARILSANGVADHGMAGR